MAFRDVGRCSGWRSFVVLSPGPDRFVSATSYPVRYIVRRAPQERVAGLRPSPRGAPM